MTTSIAIVCPRTLLWVRTSSQTRDSMRKGVRAADNSCHSEEGRESILAATESEKSGQRLSPTKDFWRVQQPENKKKEKSRTLMISWRMLFTCNLCGVSWPWHAHLGIPLPCWPLYTHAGQVRVPLHQAWWPDIWGCGPAQALEHCQPPSRQHTQEAPQGSGKPAIVRDYNSMLEYIINLFVF